MRYHKDPSVTSRGSLTLHVNNELSYILDFNKEMVENFCSHLEVVNATTTDLNSSLSRGSNRSLGPWEPGAWGKADTQIL